MARQCAYKICAEAAWVAYQQTGVLPPSAVDEADGFVHLSTRAQLAETARRHFAGVEHLWLVELDLAPLGAAVRWEPSRGGALFPHVYGVIDGRALVRAAPLRRGADGELQLDAWFLGDQPAAGGSDSTRKPEPPAKP